MPCTASYFVAARMEIADPFSCNIPAAKGGKERQLFLRARAVPVIQMGISGLPAEAQQKCWFYGLKLDSTLRRPVLQLIYLTVSQFMGALFSAPTVRIRPRDLFLPRDMPDS